MRGFESRWAGEDLRPALIFDDVRSLELDGFRAESAAGSEPAVWLHNVVDGLVRGSSMGPAQHFLRVSGAQSNRVNLLANDWSRVTEPVIYGAGVARSVVRAVGNITAPEGAGR